MNTQLGGLATRLLRYAPLWGAHGPMLEAAVTSAIRLYRAGQRSDLLDRCLGNGSGRYLDK